MIDTHLHLWRRRDAPQVGIPSAPYLQRDFRWDDLVAAWDGLPVEQAVAVQVCDFVDGCVEARFLADEVDREHVGGVVAWAQLENPDVLHELQRLLRIPALRGIRRTCQIESDPQFCRRPEYARGVRLLGELGLVCDICVRLEQLQALPRLAQACPETTIVLEHLGKPSLTEPPPAYWLRAIEELAALSNVVAKLSVVVQRPDDPPLAADAVSLFIRHLLECFGPDRLMFGSNWPVSTAVIDYRGWVDLVRALVGDDERVWSETARRVYRT